MNSNVTENSLNILKKYSDIPITAEDILNIESSVSRECRLYFIGKYCEREKYRRKNNESIHELCTRLGQDFGYSEPAMRRLVSYYKAIDYLRSIVPDIASDILCGTLGLSVENVRNLAKRSHSEVLDAVDRVKSGKERLCAIFPERRSVKPASALLDRTPGCADISTVKDTPAYDPDAQIMGLTYTIPSWVTAIERVFMSDRLREVSKPALKRLIKELYSLKSATELMLELLLEESAGKGRI